MTTSRILLLAAAIATPVLFVTGQALLPDLGRDPDSAFPLMLECRNQLILSRLLTAAGAYLLLPLRRGISSRAIAGISTGHIRDTSNVS